MTVPISAFQSYPTRCNNTVWQKFKSVKDKAMNKTGLGPLLKTAEKTWLTIPWKDLDAKKLKATSLQQAQANKVKALTAMQKVSATVTAVEAARDKARLVKANTALSNAARGQAEVIVNGLTAAAQRLNTVNTTDFDDEITRLGG